MGYGIFWIYGKGEERKGRMEDIWEMNRIKINVYGRIKNSNWKW